MQISRAVKLLTVNKPINNATWSYM